MLHFKKRLNVLELKVSANTENPSPNSSSLNFFFSIFPILLDFLTLWHVLDLV